MTKKDLDKLWSIIQGRNRDVPQEQIIGVDKKKAKLLLEGNKLSEEKQTWIIDLVAWYYDEKENYNKGIIRASSQGFSKSESEYMDKLRAVRGYIDSIEQVECRDLNGEIAIVNTNSICSIQNRIRNKNDDEYILITNNRSYYMKYKVTDEVIESDLELGELEL